jgi:perosamine synthetase
MIPWAQPDYHGGEKKLLVEALNSTWLSDGKFVKDLENKVAKLVNSKFAISVSSCTAAIHLAYLALGLKRGDEIIIPGFGYLAAANIALLMDLKPVFVDVDLETFCVTSKTIEKKITKKTKLIVVFNTYGNVCDLDPIIKLAKKKNIPILEDAAESFGSKYKNKQSGTLTEIGTYSFQATKTITTGEGGMVVANMKKNFTDRLKFFRSHGVKSKRYYHYLPGHNFRLTNVQASIGCAQLNKINKIIIDRKRIYQSYQKEFKNVSGLKLQKLTTGVKPVMWTLGILLDPKKFKNRDKIIKLMKKKNIETRNGFYSPNRMPLYKNCNTSNLKNAEMLSRNVICLPYFTSLKQKDIKYISKTLLELKR